MKNIILLILLILISYSAGCSVAGKKLYIFKIDHIPSEKDWDNSLSYNLPVEKGRLNRSSPKLSKLDKETIHASNKTCHHVDPSTPVNIKLSAFYNESNLFLRIQWPDKNKDAQPALWVDSSKTFVRTMGIEDGLGIIWNKDNIPSNNCLSSCHLNEWQVQNSILTPTHQMKTKNNEVYDLWVWWAGRNTKDNSIWELNIDSSGIDEPSPFYSQDSSYLQKELGENKYFLQNNGKTPNIYSQSFYKDGIWTLTITSPLNSYKKNFNDCNSYHFQIAIFDNTFSDHSISSEIQEMVFIKNEIKQIVDRSIP